MATIATSAQRKAIEDYGRSRRESESRGKSYGSALAGAAVSGALSGSRVAVNGDYGGGRNSSSGGKAASGSVSYQEGPDISRYYEDLIDSIRAQQRAEEQRKQAAINQGVNTLSAQKPVLEQQYQDAAQQAYIQMMQSRKALPQVMGAQGLSGGLSESSLVDLDATYGQNLNALRQQRDQGLAGIDSDIANLRASGDLSLADTASQYAQLLGDLAREQMQTAQAQRQQYSTLDSGPALSYSQAYEAFQNGNRSANVMNLLRQYYGSDWDGVSGAELTTNARNWLNKANANLASGKLTAGTPNREENLGAALIMAYRQGQLSRSEALAIAGQNGFTLNI
jgi:hypothetical protein